ncbi:MAG: alpha/beta hydrolase-fold protein [Crocinitomicaceae bacterium]
MKFSLLALFVSAIFLTHGQVIQQAVSGKIDHLENFPSQFVEARNIDVWLPANYDGKKKFSVLYMHDGQMLFDPEISWNKQAWDVDDVATKLMREGKVRDFIVVGIWNAGSKRHSDYFPQKPFENLTQLERDSVNSQLSRRFSQDLVFQPNSDNYLKFIVKELKPFIDKKYAVFTNQKNTFIAGSSMGGLISMYAICEYPNVFGGAACISTHWIGSHTAENNPIPNAFEDYLRNNLPSPKNHRVYFDCGDQTLDAFYPAIQHQVDEIMKSKGFTAKNWFTGYFPGKNHSEAAWHERLDIPLVFLLGK